MNKKYSTLIIVLKSFCIRKVFAVFILTTFLITVGGGCGGGSIGTGTGPSNTDTTPPRSWAGEDSEVEVKDPQVKEDSKKEKKKAKGL